MAQFLLRGHDHSIHPDGTGPVVNNLTLNDILDGDAYSVNLTFSGSITSTGTYPLAGATLTFSDPTAPASESQLPTIARLGLSVEGAFSE